MTNHPPSPDIHLSLGVYSSTRTCKTPAQPYKALRLHSSVHSLAFYAELFEFWYDFLSKGPFLVVINTPSIYYS